eukprot:TRINITY_DN65343_c0_g1_i1.p1 TRINITY_DN65343_c0_g1~~TRINITY_DN65343_c0_g1_i1.p1  ORF type:complete len:421 (+),score=35.98 TRINITY_DN65343_c0_g1_i1:63-1325(+)
MIVSGYFIVKKIGYGSQAQVFEAARRRKTQHFSDVEERFAVKVFHGKKGQRSFEQESHILRALQGHCNIVRLVDSFESNSNVVAVVLELCDTDLLKLLSRRDLPELDAVHIMRGALSGLVHMHQREIMHRDVKPENIAIAGDGSARLLDFALAAYLSDAREMSRRCGSLEYMAPEFFTKKPCGLPMDMFAFGATLYYALGKQFPLMEPGTTYALAAAKSRRYFISFGSGFSHASKESTELILWLMHPCDAWRPDSSFASTCPPFSCLFQVGNHDLVRSFETQLPSRIDAELHPHPPPHQREGLARPTPLHQFKEKPSEELVWPTIRCRSEGSNTCEHTSASNVSTSDSLPFIGGAESSSSSHRIQGEVAKAAHSRQVANEMHAKSFADRVRVNVLETVRKSCVLDAPFLEVSRVAPKSIM